MFKNIADVQETVQEKFSIDPPTQLTIIRAREKIEVNGNVQNVHNECLGRSCLSTNSTTKKRLVETLTVHYDSDELLYFSFTTYVNPKLLLSCNFTIGNEVYVNTKLSYNHLNC